MNKKYLKRIGQVIVLGLAIASLQGCATLCGDNSRIVAVQSYPQGAGIYVDGMRQGTTPSNITLPTYIYGGKTILLKKEGYQDQAVVVNSKFQPCSLWNLLMWPCFIVDAATGNLVKIDPANLNVQSTLDTVPASASK